LDNNPFEKTKIMGQDLAIASEILRDTELPLAKIVSLEKFSSIKIGGEALLVEASNLSELEGIIEAVKQAKAKFLIIGDGTNTLYPDSGLDVLALKLTGDFSAIDIISAKEGLIRAGAGAHLSHFLSIARQNSLGEAEFLAGIPGTVGGAVMGNAGAAGESIGELLQSLRVYEPEKGLITITSDDLKLGYRRLGSTKLSPGAVIVDADFKLTATDPGEISRRINQRLSHRAENQPYEPSLGCVFLNPPDQSAGLIIDQCGLKDLVVGGAAVSRQHANFIVNRNRALSSDVFTLAKKVRDEVKRLRDLTLDLEIGILNSMGQKIDLDGRLV
jgi:UDP-N-acetylmuramate dehydrogenase